MSVVGIDFGCDTCKVAVARRAAITVVRNEESSYLTPSLVGYTNRERLIGAAGASRWKSNAKNTINEIKRLLRRPAGTAFNEDRQWLQYKTVRSSAGYVNLRVEYQNKEIELTPEQVLGALLVKLKTMVSMACDDAIVKDVVISCPSYFADSQRQAILEAAEIAGLHVLRIMNETTAAALNWGILRPLPKEDTKKVAIVDVGDQSTNVTIVDFTEGKLSVLSTACHRNLGGRDFDRVLFNYFARQFQERTKIDLREKPKSVLRLLETCKKVKKMLSANKHAHASIECIYGDHDIQCKIQRDEFEELCAPMLKELIVPCEQALKRAKVTTDKIDVLEIIGGSVRIPAIAKALGKIFDKEVSRTLDGDESVARGCTLQCAMLSPSFRVKSFEVIDRVTYPILVKWGPVTEDPSDEETTDKSSGSSPLFTMRDPVPCTKMITFKIPGTFQLQARYTNPDDLPPGVDPFIGRFIINIPSPTESAKSAKTKVKFVVDKCGMLRPPTATYIEEVPLPVEVEELPPAEGPTPAPEPEKADAMETDETPSDESPAEGGDKKSENEEEDKGKAEESPEKKKKKKTTKTERRTINVDSILFYGTPPDVQKAAIAQEQDMQKADNEVKMWEEARNDVESYVLEFRDNIYEKYAEYVDEATRGNIMAQLDSSETWLYDSEPGGGEQADLKAYREKLADLQAIGAPVQQRKWEFDRRETAINVLKKTIINYSKMAADESEKMAHIPRSERDKICEACTAADSWLLELQQKQDKVPKTADPILLVSELQQQANKLKSTCQPILDKPAPSAPNPKALEDQRAMKELEEAAKKAVAAAAAENAAAAQEDAEMQDANADEAPPPAAEELGDVAPCEAPLPPAQGPTAPMDVDAGGLQGAAAAAAPPNEDHGGKW